MALVSAPGQNRERKTFSVMIYCRQGVFGGRVLVECDEMRVAEEREDSGLSEQDGFCLPGGAKT